MEKTNWFKNKKKDEKGMMKIKKGDFGGGKKNGITKDQGKKKSNVKSVIFVTQTQGSRLAKALREEEEMMEHITGYRLKIVERAQIKPLVWGRLCQGEMPTLCN